jgi:hypothetical protein
VASIAEAPLAEVLAGKRKKEDACLKIVRIVQIDQPIQCRACWDAMPKPNARQRALRVTRTAYCGWEYAIPPVVSVMKLTHARAGFHEHTEES